MDFVTNNGIAAFHSFPLFRNHPKSVAFSRDHSAINAKPHAGCERKLKEAGNKEARLTDLGCMEEERG